MSKKRQWKTAADRRADILQAAVDLSIQVGYRHLTRVMVSEHIGVVRSLITFYFPTMDELKKAVMQAAVDYGIPIIISQGLSDYNPIAMNAPIELKKKALDFLKIYAEMAAHKLPKIIESKE